MFSPLQACLTHPAEADRPPVARNCGGPPAEVVGEGTRASSGLRRAFVVAESNGKNFPGISLDDPTGVTELCPNGSAFNTYVCGARLCIDVEAVAIRTLNTRWTPWRGAGLEHVKDT